MNSKASCPTCGKQVTVSRFHKGPITCPGGHELRALRGEFSDGNGGKLDVMLVTRAEFEQSFDTSKSPPGPRPPDQSAKAARRQAQAERLKAEAAAEKAAKEAGPSESTPPADTDDERRARQQAVLDRGVEKIRAREDAERAARRLRLV